ncbi:uncharacterized protein L969DRAFT_42450 [Mixia osmundae IAM 14324]|uniref:PHP domain-like protein n=1 Tax=Mixia osmundae (strain CBS 9802 / IAM 14324 / JCM 22182 / KY 12970) TaxID=764103 RepID=G7E090_MIXOS|nr:uncharacterized protein L969DRAFT_42450 [Mixia osmundae IAM 14324]KEI42240.1 hypothetical protein L969DRAFT_42450 [Mixia osmundae IAM 14324]GAA96250.1 hypothetical protein E5Q_02914 [Mixia osmundae IAM 14324]
MYYDLSLPWPAIPAESSKSVKGKQKAKPSDDDGSEIKQRAAVEALSSHVSRDQIKRAVELAAQLSYDAVAFNSYVPVGALASPSQLPSLNALGIKGLVAPFPDLDIRHSSSVATQRLLQLSRVTIAVDEQSISGGKGNGLFFTSANASALASFDIVAAHPLDGASFTYVCLSLSGPGPSGVDIITLDLAIAPRLPFQLKRSAVVFAVKQGVFFEIAYGPMMRSSSASSTAYQGLPEGLIGRGPGREVPKDARKYIIAGARELVRLTKGKNIILSSEIRRAMELRAPEDLFNLCHIFGLKSDDARKTLQDNPKAAVLHGYAIRKTHRAVIGVPTIKPLGTTELVTKPHDRIVAKTKRKPAEDARPENLIPAQAPSQPATKRQRTD